MQGRFQEACAEYERALAEDGANREAKVLFEMAVKAFRVQCEWRCLLHIVVHSLLVDALLFKIFPGNFGFHLSSQKLSHMESSESKVNVETRVCLGLWIMRRECEEIFIVVRCSRFQGVLTQDECECV